MKIISSKEVYIREIAYKLYYIHSTNLGPIREIPEYIRLREELAKILKTDIFTIQFPITGDKYIIVYPDNSKTNYIKIKIKP